jgi:hypothetical protein
LVDDRPLLEAINHGDFLLNGFRNRDLPHTHRHQASPDARALLLAILAAALTTLNQVNQLWSAALKNRRSTRRFLSLAMHPCVRQV